MVAGQSIKLESGFKLNTGGKLKISVDPTDPTLKSNEIEEILAPQIMGSKNAKVGDEFVVLEKDYYASVFWQLIGYNYSCKSEGGTFVVPDNLQNGQYTLVVTGNIGDQIASSSKIVVVKKPTNENNLVDIIKSRDECVIFPNPVSTSISIILDSEISEYDMRIRNTVGKVVLTKSGFNTGRLDLDVSSLKQGVYFVELNGGNERLQTLKFIKR